MPRPQSGGRPLLPAAVRRERVCSSLEHWKVRELERQAKGEKRGRGELIYDIITRHLTRTMKS